MSLTEQSSTSDCLAKICENFNGIYELRTFGKRHCFLNQNGVPFQVFMFPGRDALGAEYASNAEDAAAGCFEDGDLFYLKDYDSLDSLQAAIMAEIQTAE